MNLSSADIDGDGINELIIPAQDSIVIYSYLSNSNKSIKTTIDSPVSLADLDGDSDVELIFNDNGEEIHVLHHNGEKMYGWPQSSIHPFSIIADINLDSVPEIITNDLYVYDIYGNKLIEEKSEWNFYANIICADVDNNDSLEIIYSDGYSSINIIDSKGDDFVHWQSPSYSGTISTTPLITELDNNQDIELISSAKKDSWSLNGAYLYVQKFNFDSVIFSDDQWNTEFYDNKNSLYQNFKYQNLPPAKPQFYIGEVAADSITLHWNIGAECDLKNYKLFKSVNGSGYFEYQTIDDTCTIYSDTDVHFDSLYSYHLVLTDDIGQESISDTASIMITDPMFPRGISSYPLHIGRYFEWLANNEVDLSHYNVYKSVDKGDHFTLINSTPNSYYFDTISILPDTVFYYITAVDSSGNESFKSSSFFETCHVFVCVDSLTAQTDVMKNTVGDINNDGYDDIIMIEENRVVSYLNNSNGTFAKYQDISYKQYAKTDIGWGTVNAKILELADINNDGFLDLFVGTSSWGYGIGGLEIILNDSSGNFIDSYKFIEKNPTSYFNLKVIDIDNDGDLDIVGGAGFEIGVTNSTQDYIPINEYEQPNMDNLTINQNQINTAYPLYIFKNISGEFFISQEISHISKIESIEFSDLNNDSYLDLIIGLNSCKNEKALVFRNDSNGIFNINQTIDYNANARNLINVTDVNHDDKNDLIITDNNYLNILENNGGSLVLNNINLYNNNSLCLKTGNIFDNKEEDLILGSYNARIFKNENAVYNEVYDDRYEGDDYETRDLELSDFDLDGDLDMLSVTNHKRPQILLNTTSYYREFTSPSVPNNLSSSINGNFAELIWDKSTDGQSYQDLLKYNIQLGTSSNNYNMISGKVSSSAIESNHISLNLEESGTYYWRVQAVDAQKNKSGWSNEQSFTIVDQKSPQIVRISPKPSSEHVMLDDSIIISFSERIDSSLIDLEVLNSQNEICSGEIKFNDNLNVLTFFADSNFKAGDSIFISLKNIQDNNGNTLPDTFWTFKCIDIQFIIKKVSTQNENNEAYIGQNNYYNIIFQNIGVKTAKNLRLRITHESDYVDYYIGSYTVIDSIQPQQEYNFSSYFRMKNNCPPGYELTFYLELTELSPYNVYIEDSIVFKPLIDIGAPKIVDVYLDEHRPAIGDSVKITAELMDGAGVKSCEALVYDAVARTPIFNLPMERIGNSNIFTVYCNNYMPDKYYYIDISATDSLNNNIRSGNIKAGFSTHNFNLASKNILYFASDYFYHHYTFDNYHTIFNHLNIDYDCWFQFYDGIFPQNYWENELKYKNLFFIMPFMSSIEFSDTSTLSVNLSKCPENETHLVFSTTRFGDILYDSPNLLRHFGVNKTSYEYGSFVFEARHNEIISEDLEIRTDKMPVYNFTDYNGHPILWNDSNVVAFGNEILGTRIAVFGHMPDDYQINQHVYSLFDDLIIWLNENDPVPPDTIAPIALSNMNFVANEDTQLYIDLNEFYEDNRIDSLIFTIGKISDSINVELTNNNRLILIPQENWYGDDQFQITISDKINVLIDTIYISVLPVNDPPELNKIGTVIIKEDYPYSLEKSTITNDIDGDSLIFYLSENSKFYYKHYDDSILIIPEKNWFGSEQLFIQISDLEYNFNDTINITVLPENDPPELCIKQVFIYEDNTLSIQLDSFVVDVDNEYFEIKFSENAYFNFSIDNDFINIIPNKDWYGDENLYVSLSDYFSETIDTFAIHVIPVNDNPVKLKDTIIRLGENSPIKTLNLDSIYFDSDNEYLNYALINTSGKLHSEITDELLFYFPEKDYRGKEFVSIKVDDETSYIIDTIWFYIFSENTEPMLLTDSLNIQINEDIKVGYRTSKFVYDEDNDDLTFNFSKNKNIALYQNKDIIYFEPSLNWFGIQTIDFNVSDIDTTISGKFIIDVLPINDLPYKTNNPVFISFEDDSTQSINLNEFYRDIDDEALHYRLIKYSPKITASIEQDVLSLKPLKNANGEAYIKYNVTDKSGYIRDSILFNIFPVNDSPVITNKIDTIKIKPFEEKPYVINYYDPDDSTLISFDYYSQSGRTNIELDSLSTTSIFLNIILDSELHENDDIVLIIKDKTGLTDRDSVIISPNRITDISIYKEDKNIKVYPQPAYEELNIESFSSPIKHIEMFNLEGKKVLSQNINQLFKAKLNLKNFSEGVYYVVIEQGEQKSIKKIVLLKQ